MSSIFLARESHQLKQIKLNTWIYLCSAHTMAKFLDTILQNVLVIKGNLSVMSQLPIRYCFAYCSHE